MNFFQKNIREFLIPIFIFSGYLFNHFYLAPLFLYGSLVAVLYTAFSLFRFSLDPLYKVKNYILKKFGNKENLFVNLLTHLLREEPAVNVHMIPAMITFTKTIIESTSSPVIVLVPFLVFYFYSIIITILLFGIIFKYGGLEIVAQNSDYILVSTLRFFAGSNPKEIISTFNLNNWWLAFESGMTFYYLVIAIMTFSVISQYRSNQIKEIFILLYKKNVENKSSEIFDVFYPKKNDAND